MSTLKLGKNMVAIDMDHGKLHHNFWCSNLTVTKIGNRINQVGFMDNEGKFIPYPECGNSRYVNVLGFSDYGYHDSAVANLMRLMCFLIKDKVDAMTNRLEGDGRNSFTNGGMMSNGNLVEEAIIYTPYLGYSGADEYQAIFSMFPAYRDTEAYLGDHRPKLKLNGEDRYIDGVRLQEDGSPRRFSDALGTLDVRLAYEHELDWVMGSFGPDELRPTHAKYAVSVHMGQFMQYVNTIAQLIFLNYFNGKSYEEMVGDVREQTVTNVDYSKCGLCMDWNLVEYYVYPACYSGAVNLYHTTDSTKDRIGLALKDYHAEYTHIEGREF